MSRHEITDAHIPSIVRFGVGLFLLMVLAMAVMWLMFRFLGDKPSPDPMASSPLVLDRTIPPEPKLQVSPEKDLQATREAEEEGLNSYGWVDQTAGIVRIPIDVAMERLVSGGLPEATKDEER